MGHESLRGFSRLILHWRFWDLTRTVGNDGVGAIAHALANHKTIQALHLCDSKIGDEGAKSIAHALKTNTSLKKLLMRNNTFTDAGVEDIANALKINTSLEVLDISFNEFGDYGAKAIADALVVNTSLKVLILSHTGIKSDGLSAIAVALNTIDREFVININGISHNNEHLCLENKGNRNTKVRVYDYTSTVEYSYFW